MRRRRVTPLLLLSSLIGGSVEAATPFTVAVLPDTQYYTQTTSRNDLYFKGQTRWIVNNRANQNIAFVLHLGDIQNEGNPYYASTTNRYEPDLTRPTGLISDERQWVNADAALDILDAAGMPYGLVAGNHDYLDHNIKDEPIYFLKWFGPKRFAGKPWFGGSSPEMGASLAGMNMYFLFEAGGRTYLNIGLQYQPDTNDLRWAQSIINQNPGIPTIVTTHAMLNTTGYQSGRQNIFSQFVRNNPQVLMTMNGHINGAYRRSDPNIAGQQVHQMLVDYQATAFPGYFNGAGYMRLMEFDTDHSVVRVKSYSPVTGEYLTDSLNQFDLPVDINGRFGAAPGTPGYLRQATFREGEGGYSGVLDTYVDAGAATSAAGAATTGIWVDGDASDTDGSQPRHGLIRFTNLFGGQGIPAGAVIESATLTLTTSVATDAHSPNSMSLYRMLASWGNGSTWGSTLNGITADGTEAILAANGTVVPTDQGTTVSFDVTESLYAWSVGAVNYGWAVLPGGTNGWRFDSSEAADVSLRPQLSVSYFVPAVGGDANLDGAVNGEDLALIDRGLAMNLTGWSNGDFNGDGVVNQADYLLIDTTLASQGGGLSGSLLAMREAQFGAGYTAALMAAVPEPALGLGAAVVLCGLRRRCR